MKSIPSFFHACLFFVGLTLLSACSAHHPTTAATTARPAPAAPGAEYDADDDVSQGVAAESDQDLQEELSGLEKLGGWEAGVRSGQSCQREDVKSPGLDPSINYDFPVTLNKQVEFYLDLFQTKQRKTFQTWLSRSSRYLPMIRKELGEAGLPLDLAYLAMIESGYHPSAVSSAQAVGMWQFIDETGQRHGLRVDSWVDERRDPEKATKAAADYLASLHERYDDWQLAVAAYNAGEGKIDRGIERFGCSDFWEIAQYDYLAMETKRYVPKLMAAIIIARQPEKYGFTDIEYAAPLEYDLVKVPGRTDLQAIATSANTDLRRIKELNNDLKKNQTPAVTSSWSVRIPKGSKDLVAANLKRLHPITRTEYTTHVVKKGDTLTEICNRYELSKTTLLKANNLRYAKLKNGQRLRIPQQVTQYVLLKEGETPGALLAASSGGKGKGGSDGKSVTQYTVRKGDTVANIARQYKVQPDKILQWNNLKNPNALKIGQKLALNIETQPIVKDGTKEMRVSRVVVKATTVAAKPKAGPLVVVAGKKKKPDSANRELTAAAEGMTYYQVRSGDSLWAIAQKFQVSAAELRRWNGLRNDNLRTGSKLIVGKS